MAPVSSLQFADLEPVGPSTPTGRYLRRFWHPVCRAKDLAPGKALPIEILGEKFTLYRGADGTPHVVAFRCAHRGTQLSVGWIEGDDLRCRYHGWKFDASGQCVEQPNEDKPFCARVKIPSYPTREYLGLVFAYLGEGAPPKFRQYPDFDQPGVIVADPVETFPCTFWNRLENDYSHIPWVHRATGLRKGRKDVLVLRREAIEETPYGWTSTRLVKFAEERALGLAGAAHLFMPNAFQFWVRTRARGFEHRDLWDTKITWTVPVNDRKFAAFDVTHTPLDGEDARLYAENRARDQEAEAETRWDLAQLVLAGAMTLEDIPGEIDAYTSFVIEDYVTQVGQGPVATRSPELLAVTDVKTLMVRKLWFREIAALLEDRPLTDWRMPAEPLRLHVMAPA